MERNSPFPSGVYMWTGSLSGQAQERRRETRKKMDRERAEMLIRQIRATMRGLASLLDELEEEVSKADSLGSDRA